MGKKSKAEKRLAALEAASSKKLDREAKRALKKEKFLRNKVRFDAEFAGLTQQLAVFGLLVQDVAADGNCMFRAVADQMEGNQNRHGEYRQMAMDYVLNHREMFEAFIDEDDGPFEDVSI